MGYEVVLYITRDETTENFFHRFQKVEIRDRVWEVQFVNDLSSDTLLIVYLKEDFVNEFDPVTNTTDDAAGGDAPIEPDIPVIGVPAINGSDELYPFDKATYRIENAENGTWLINGIKGKIESQTSEQVNIIITSAKSGAIDLIYRRENEDDIVKTITIKSL